MTNRLQNSKEESNYSFSIFFETYEESKKDFIRLSKKITKSFPYSEINQIQFSKSLDPIDCLLLKKKKNNSKKLILISSGVHGVEGFTGSAIQRYLMKQTLDENDLFDSDVLFLHGINSYGFKNKKRVNENNIDLNRNFFFKREKIPKKEKNLGYRRFASFFMPKFPFTFWFLEYFIFFVRFTGIMFRIGIKNFSNAFVNGQFEFKKGLYFGGKRPESVVKRLRKFFKSNLAKYKWILHLDIHTGHGEANGLLLIQNANLGTPEDNNIMKIIEGLPILKPDSGGAFYKTAGDFTDFLSKIFLEQKKIFPLTLEIGTLGNDSLIKAIRTSFLMVAENRIRHCGSWFVKNKEKVEHMFFRYFYPDSEIWRKVALEKSIETIQTLSQRFSKLH